MLTLRQKVVWFALFSRFSLLLLQLVANAVVPDHDAQGVFKRPLSPTASNSLLDNVVDVLVGGLARWDAQYFFHIAENGYVYENTLAFFPLFPITIRFISGCLNIVFRGLLANQSLLLLASVSLNTVCFVKAADALYCLSLRVLQDEALAYKAALLFCINPASIFFTAPYSESMFVLLSFQGMIYSIDRDYFKWCAIPFGLAAAARSNGILNIGFILHSGIQEFIKEKWFLLRTNGWSEKLLIIMKSWPAVSQMVECFIIAVAPFLAYQVYCYVLFCTPQKVDSPTHIVQYGLENGLVLPQETLLERNLGHWCNAKLPIAYSYVQDHYWNVGFLRYYEWKQLPNFMLACPIVLLILLCSVKYFKHNQPLLRTLGFQLETNSKRMKGTLSPDMFVFVVHVTFLTLFCLAFVHIQVTTRMICSASPVPYWYAAYLFNCKTKRSKARGKDCKILIMNQMKKLNPKKIATETSPTCPEQLDNMDSRWKVLILSEIPTLKGKVILVYFLSYALLGTVLFSNFLPWT